MDFPSRREVYLMFWRHKAHVNVSDEAAYDSYWSYFKRSWYEHEGESLEILDAGFDEVWKEKLKKEQKRG